ncbi:hypothetical protein GCM10027046_27150 [Uliginosibacterium flavum]
MERLLHENHAGTLACVAKENTMLIERDMTEFSCPRTGPVLAGPAPMQADRDLISPQAQLQLCQIEREPAAPAHPMMVRNGWR